jgi:hypothetical protein
MSAVLRHLPVAVRLLRLETAVRDLHNAIVQKAPSGKSAMPAWQRAERCETDLACACFYKAHVCSNKLERTAWHRSKCSAAIGGCCACHLH